tara:strand:- start:3 stop:239 length:237 start_codon:yes stop_codon:yes gene_type:complete
MVRYENISENIKVKIDCKFNNIFASLINELNPNIETPARAGMDIKNEIFAASCLLNFNSRAAVIIIPDLLTPGTIAKA